MNSSVVTCGILGEGGGTLSENENGASSVPLGVSILYSFTLKTQKTITINQTREIAK